MYTDTMKRIFNSPGFAKVFASGVVLLLLICLASSRLHAASDDGKAEDDASAFSAQAAFFVTADLNNSLRIVFTDASTTSVGTITGWEWDFGDLTTKSTVKNPVHVYDAAGQYTVILKVTNSGGETSTTQKSVVVSPYLNPIFSLSPTSGATPLNVTFNSSASTGPIASRTWHIRPATGWAYISGNGSSVSPTVTFTTQAEYNVSLTVSDGVDSETSPEQTVAVGSGKGFAAAAEWTQPVYANYIIDFTDKTNYFTNCNNTTIVDPVWQFSDGARIVGPRAQHVFTTTGSHTVVLTVQDGCGNRAQKTINIDALGAKANITAAFSMDKNKIRKGQMITFADNSFATPPDEIGYWLWWYEQPFALDPNSNVVTQNNIYQGYDADHKPNPITHRFMNAGDFTVRLAISARVERMGLNLSFGQIKRSTFRKPRILNQIMLIKT